MSSEQSIEQRSSSVLRSSNQWLPLMDYSVKRGVSLSTLRRYIKADKIQYRLEGGKYLILDEANPELSAGTAERFRLEQELQQAREEICELKMLIAIYEERLQLGSTGSSHSL